MVTHPSTSQPNRTRLRTSKGRPLLIGPAIESGTRRVPTQRDRYTRLRPYYVEYTGSRPITEVKQRWAWLLLEREVETVREYQVSWAFTHLHPLLWCGSFQAENSGDSYIRLHRPAAVKARSMATCSPAPLPQAVTVMYYPPIHRCPVYQVLTTRTRPRGPATGPTPDPMDQDLHVYPLAETHPLLPSRPAIILPGRSPPPNGYTYPTTVAPFATWSRVVPLRLDRLKPTRPVSGTYRRILRSTIHCTCSSLERIRYHRTRSAPDYSRRTSSRVDPRTTSMDTGIDNTFLHDNTVFPVGRETARISHTRCFTVDLSGALCHGDRHASTLNCPDLRSRRLRGVPTHTHGLTARCLHASPARECYRAQPVPAHGQPSHAELYPGRPTPGPSTFPLAADLLKSSCTVPRSTYFRAQPIPARGRLYHGRPTSGSSTLPSAADLSEVELCRGRPTRPTACTTLAATRVRIGNAPIITHVRTSHWIPTGTMDVYIHRCMHNTHVLYMYPC